MRDSDNIPSDGPNVWPAPSPSRGPTSPTPGATPGPFVVCEDFDGTFPILTIEQDRAALSDAEEPSVVAEVYTCGEGIDIDVARANARLIASAPDLLAFVERVACERPCEGARITARELLASLSPLAARGKGGA